MAEVAWNTRDPGWAKARLTAHFGEVVILEQEESACEGFSHRQVRSVASPSRATLSKTTCLAILRCAPLIYTCRPAAMDEICRCWSTSLASRAVGYLTRIGSASARTCRSGSTG